MWFWYSLAAAFLSAVVVLLNKVSLKEVSASVVTWSLFALPLPFLGVVALRGGIPAVSNAFWVGVIGSAGVFAVAKVLGMSSMRQTALSQVYPLVTLNTLFTYGLGLVFLGETIRFIPIVGLVLIVVGAYWLNIQMAAEHVLMPLITLAKERNSRLFLVAAFLAAVASVFDKTAILNIDTNNLAMVLFVEDLLMMLILTVYMMRMKLGWIIQVKNNLGVLGLGSVIYTLSSLLVLGGFAGAPIALVSGVKQLQLLLVLLLSWIFLGDKPRKGLWGAVAVMLIGVMLVRGF